MRKLPTSYRVSHKFTHTIVIKMTISYECENCGKYVSHTEKVDAKADRKTRTVTETMGRAWNPVSDAEKEETKTAASKAAQEKLKKRIEKRQEKYRSRCPHCGYLQSWMIESAKKSRGYLILGAALVVATVSFFLVRLLFPQFGVHSGFGLCGFCLALQLGAAAVGYLLNRLIPFRPNKDYAAVARVNAPSVSFELPSDSKPPRGVI